MAVKILNGIDVDGSMNIVASDVPNLDASKITSGTLSADRIPNLSGVYQPAGDYLTLETAETTFQPLGNYLTSIPAEYLTQTEGDARYLKLSGGTISGNLEVGATNKTSDTVVRSLADQNYKAGFEAYGNGQGTGYFYAGQSNSYGGGFSYNGDGSPAFINNEDSDHITFFRRAAGVNSEVFHYSYNSNDVYFNGAITVSGGNSNQWNTAYGWGNHASVGYLTSLPSHNHDTLYDALGSADAVNVRIDEEVFPALNDLGNAIPTNNNQLTNGAGYITSFDITTQTDGKYLRSNADDSFSGNLTSAQSKWIKFYHPTQTDSNDGKIGAGIFDTGLNIVGVQTVAGTGRQVRVWGDLITSTGTKYATESYVSTAVSNLVASAPGALNTLNELAAALGDDANFSTTVTNNIAAVHERIETEVLPAIDAKQNAGNYFTDGDTVLNMANNDGLVYDDTTNKMYVKLDGTNREIYHTGNTSFLSTGGGTLTGATTIQTTGGAMLTLKDTNSVGDAANPYINFVDSAGTRQGYIGIGSGSSAKLYLEGLDGIQTNNPLSVNGTVTATGGNSSNWNTAYGWGNHASAGYLTSIPSSYATDAEVATAASNAEGNAIAHADARIDAEVLPAIGDITLASLGFTGATNANYITNNNQLTNGAGYLTSSNDRVYITDSRGAARAPSYYNDRYAQWDFQNNSDTGAGGDSWHALLTVSKWSVYDNSHKQEQLIFTGDNLKRRTATSDSEWGEVKTIWDTGNLGVGDNGLTEKNFTSALKTKLDGIAGGANYIINNNQLTNGAGYITGISDFGATGTFTDTSINSGLVPGTTLPQDIRSDYYMNAHGNWMLFSYTELNNIPSSFTPSAHTHTPTEAGLGNLSSDGNNLAGNFTATGDITAFSDARVKENIETIDNALDKVTQLRGVEYNKIGSEEKSIGVVAQEIREVLPEVVKENEDGMLSVAYGNITGVLIEAIKEQQKQIEELKAKLNGLTK